MSTKISRILIVFLVAAISVATVSVAYASKPQSEEVSYTVEQRPNGYLRVRAQVNLADRGVRERYAEQQLAEALALARSGAGNVSLQVTFIRPLSVEELRLLSRQTNLIADLITIEARDASNGLHTVFVRGTGSDIVDLQALTPGLEARALRLVGIMVVRGTIPASGLGQLSSDPRVYVPDVTPHRLATRIAAQYGVSVDKVQVSVPAPHWHLSAER